LQTEYDQDDKFNAVVRSISSLPFVKPSDLDEAFGIFNRRANNLEYEELKDFTVMLLEYAQTQWRERFAVRSHF
jgi:hypothetical protein